MNELYASSPIPIREDLASAHARAWVRIGAPGTWWDGTARVAIAAETRHAASCALCRRCTEALSPIGIAGTHDSLGQLPEAAVEVTEAKGSFGGGFIVRTAAGQATPEEVRADVEFLTHTWAEIKSRADQRKGAGAEHGPPPEPPRRSCRRQPGTP